MLVGVQLRIRGGWERDLSIGYYSGIFGRIFLATVSEQTLFYAWLLMWSSWDLVMGFVFSGQMSKASMHLIMCQQLNDVVHLPT